MKNDAESLASNTNNDQNWDNFKVCDNLDTDRISNTINIDVNGNYFSSQYADQSNSRLKNIGFVINQQLFIGRVVAQLHESKLRCSIGDSARPCYRVQILAPCIGDVAPRTSKLEQFLESLFIIQPDIFVTIDSNIFVSNIHVLPGLDSIRCMNFLK
jgi:hypothetical protein